MPAGYLLCSIVGPDVHNVQRWLRKRARQRCLCYLRRATLGQAPTRFQLPPRAAERAKTAVSFARCVRGRVRARRNGGDGAPRRAGRRACNAASGLTLIRPPTASALTSAPAVVPAALLAAALSCAECASRNADICIGSSAPLVLDSRMTSLSPEVRCCCVQREYAPGLTLAQAASLCTVNRPNFTNNLLWFALATTAAATPPCRPLTRVQRATHSGECEEGYAEWNNECVSESARVSAATARCRSHSRSQSAATVPQSAAFRPYSSSRPWPSCCSSSSAPPTARRT